MVDLAKLEELAKAATPGSWAMVPAGNRPEIMCGYRSGWGSLTIARVESIQFLQDAKFIAAANPATVLDLLAEIKRLNQEVASVFNKSAETVGNLKAEIERLREALIDVAASLSAAHSLLKRGGKKAAPSNKMFEIMLDDYEKSLNRAVRALGEKK